MFILSRISDVIKIEPRNLDKSHDAAVEQAINAKYANKVKQTGFLFIFS